MEKKKIVLKDIEYDELINVYLKIEEFLGNLESEYVNVKKMEEENS